MQRMPLSVGVMICVVAVSLAGCSPSKRAPVNADGLRAIVGTSLIGAQGVSYDDQLKIDETVAGLCGAEIWAPSECARHSYGSLP